MIAHVRSNSINFFFRFTRLPIGFRFVVEFFKKSLDININDDRSLACHFSNLSSSTWRFEWTNTESTRTYSYMWRKFVFFQRQNVTFAIHLSIHQHVSVHTGTVNSGIIPSRRTSVSSERTVYIFVGNLRARQTWYELRELREVWERKRKRVCVCLCA